MALTSGKCSFISVEVFRLLLKPSKKSHNYFFPLPGVSFLFPDKKTKGIPHKWVRTHHFLGSIGLVQREISQAEPGALPLLSSLRVQMEGSSFLIIKISASLKSRSLLLALQITAFVREEQ